MKKEITITAEDVLKENYSLQECHAILTAMAGKLYNAKAAPVQEPVSAYFKDGKFAGVRVCLGGEDFIIAPHDCEWGEMNWEDTMAALKENGLTTWNYRQICLTMAYREEIDLILKENGGDPVDKSYWTCAECSVYYFYYNGYYGRLFNYGKNNTYSCRAIFGLNHD